MTDLALSPDPTLTECEAVIERGLETFVEVGQALLAIRDGKLYRESHDTFEAYCRERWDFSRSYAHRVIEASEVTEMLPMGNTPRPTSERQARALAPLRKDPEQMADAWSEAVERSNGKPTARVIEESVERRRGETVTEPWTCQDHGETQPAGSKCRLCEADRVSTVSAAQLMRTIEGAARAIRHDGAAGILARAERWPETLPLPDPDVLDDAAEALTELAHEIRKVRAA